MKMVFIIALAGSAGCGDQIDSTGGNDAPPTTITNAKDVPIDGLSKDDVAHFRAGDDLFDLPFRDVDGLGPLLHPELVRCVPRGWLARSGPGAEDGGGRCGWHHGIRRSIGAALRSHAAPGAHGRRDDTADRAATVEREGHDPDRPAGARPRLPRGDRDDRRSRAMAATEAMRGDAIHGVVPMTTFTSVPSGDGFSTFQTGDTVVGRFGLKARVATLDDFVADAFQGDMGLTTPMRPVELREPLMASPTICAPASISIRSTSTARRSICAASRSRSALASPIRARRCSIRCSASGCHVPSLHTRADYPIPQLADIDAPVYTDMLQHDMGDLLADGMTDGGADSRGWRTAPLIGLRFSMLFLHDGRASSVADAILAHAGEAQSSADAFPRTLPSRSRPPRRVRRSSLRKS